MLRVAQFSSRSAARSTWRPINLQRAEEANPEFGTLSALGNGTSISLSYDYAVEGRKLCFAWVLAEIVVVRIGDGRIGGLRAHMNHG